MTEETEKVGDILDKIGYKVIDARDLHVQKHDSHGHFHNQEWCIRCNGLNVWVRQWDNGFTCDLWPNNNIVRGMELLERLAADMPEIAKLLAEPMG